MISIAEVLETRKVKEVKVVIRKTEGDRDHEHDIVHIVVGAVEEKSQGKGAGKDGTELGAMKEEIRAEPEADTEAAVKIEAETNICEAEAEAKRGSLYHFNYLRLQNCLFNYIYINNSYMKIYNSYYC